MKNNFDKNIEYKGKRVRNWLSSLLAISLIFCSLTNLGMVNSGTVLASDAEVKVSSSNNEISKDDSEKIEESEAVVEAEAEDFEHSLLDSKVEYNDLIPYSEYIEKYTNYKPASQSIELYSSEDVSKNLDGENASIKFDFVAEQDSLYAVRVEYTIPANGLGMAQMSLYLDGENPYNEASLISLRRLYRDADQSNFIEDKNQSFPSQVAIEKKQTVYLRDDRGYISTPLLLAISKGKHQLEFKAIQDEVHFYSISLSKLEDVPAYEETKQASLNEDSSPDLGTFSLPNLVDAKGSWFNSIKEENISKDNATNGSVDVKKELKSFQYYDEQDNIIVIEAETASLKNDPALLPQNDRTSSLTSPYHPTYTRMNTIGGTAWKNNSSFIEWTVDVPTEGYYKLGFRFLQNSFRGLPVTRELRINGELPFQEASELPFYFGRAFQSSYLQDSEGKTYLFHLKKGENKIRLTYVLADVAEFAEKISRAAQKMNSIYRRIMVIMGTSPDPYRDYELLLRIPDLLDRIEEARDLLEEVIEPLRARAGDTDMTTVLSRASLQLNNFLKKPATIAKSIGQLKDNVTALGQWNLDVTIQTLTIDKIYLAGKNSTLPRADMNFLEACKHEALAFVGSFYNDGNEAGLIETSNKEDESDNKASKKIEVWVTTGRDQLDVIRRMVGDSFTKEKGVNVELKLVSSDIVLPSTFTGNGPDVVIQAGTTLPINFAFRGAALDLSQFPDFKEYSKNFSKAALACFEYRGASYALPDQMSFPVMFYRKDILAKLNIPVPQTWDDVLSILPFLQANNMEFYLDTLTPLSLGSAVSIGNSKAVNSVYLSMLYQAGGKLYNDEGTKTEITSPIGQEVFKKWTDYYTKHSFPTVVNFLTRFRLGEVPLAIVDFTNYNSLTVGAPEIAGEYGMAAIPGTLQKDGSIRRDMPVTTSAAMIIKTQVDKRGNKDSAWEFLKWWTSAETQSSYASEMEALLGAAARYPVANLESFKQIPWGYDIKEVLEECLSSLREVPQIPGSYITGRDIENAFYEVINNPRDAVPRESLEKYAEQINAEIMNKLKEFKLLPEEGGEDK